MSFDRLEDLRPGAPAPPPPPRRLFAKWLNLAFSLGGVALVVSRWAELKPWAWQYPVEGSLSLALFVFGSAGLLVWFLIAAFELWIERVRP